MGGGIGKAKTRPVPVQYDSFEDYLQKKPSTTHGPTATLAGALELEKNGGNKKRRSSTSSGGSGGSKAKPPAMSSSEDEPPSLSSSGAETGGNIQRRSKHGRGGVNMPEQTGNWTEKKHRSKERMQKEKAKLLQNVDSIHSATTAGETDPATLLFEWQHGNEWKPYESKYQEVMRNAFTANYPTIKFFIGSNDYEVNFKQMTQKNLKSGNMKKIRCSSEAKTKPGANGRMQESKFQWLDASRWKDFDWAADRVLWTDYKRGMATTRITIMGHNYDVDFMEWTQTNVRTKKSRPIRIKNIVDQGMTPDADFARQHFQTETGDDAAAGTPGAANKRAGKNEAQNDHLGGAHQQHKTHKTPSPDKSPRDGESPLRSERPSTYRGGDQHHSGGGPANEFVFQFYHEDPAQPLRGKWLNYPKGEQKLLADGWAQHLDAVSLGDGVLVDFKEMKENGKTAVRRVNPNKVRPHGGGGTQNRPPMDNPHNKRDCFEWYDPQRDEWHVYSAAEDKKLKHAWLNREPTVRFHSLHEEEEVEVNFEYLRQKTLSTGEIRSIRHPVKFGAFRRKSKHHTDGYDNADFFNDMQREREEEKEREREAQFRNTPKDDSGIWGRRFGGRARTNQKEKQHFGAGGGIPDPWTTGPDQETAEERQRRRAQDYQRKYNEFRNFTNNFKVPPGADGGGARGGAAGPGPNVPKAGPSAGAYNTGRGSDPFTRAGFGGNTSDSGSDVGGDPQGPGQRRPQKPTPLPQGPKLDASVNAVTRELYQDMEAHLGDAIQDRKQCIKKWQLAYHPDKNPEKVDKYKQVFQFLMEHKEWFLLGRSPNNSPKRGK
ncbi:unnamed protein product [Amoebophrya sp. A25]|nr:unnamed protein product [Amoebophrya sp. A25]|eukprot:GSA25T00016516001.1